MSKRKRASPFANGCVIHDVIAVDLWKLQVSLYNWLSRYNYLRIQVIDFQNEDVSFHIIELEEHNRDIIFHVFPGFRCPATSTLPVASPCRSYRWAEQIMVSQVFLAKQIEHIVKRRCTPLTVLISNCCTFIWFNIFGTVLE